ncbi:hypothetical protein FD723_30190 [Nostoc sp. C052]|nr:hypothetical protein FD723_30190 [Nostoc sp. C052]
MPWRMEFAAIQTKPTSVGFQFLESAQADLVCVAAISNRLVFLLSLRCSPYKHRSMKRWGRLISKGNA